MSEIHDVIIVGSGPAGYTASIYAARAQLKPLVFEGSVTAGGALMNTTDVENFPGFPEGVMGPDLMEKLRDQAEKFGSTLIADDIVSMDLKSDIKTVAVADGTTYQAKTVILAMGSGYRKLEVEGEEEFSGRGVSWCATCDGFFFRDREIAVIGGGDSAVTEAQFLSRFGSTVHVIHRRDELRASQIMADRLLANDKVTMHWNSVVEKINGQTTLESLTLRNTETGETSDLPVSGMFVAIGHEPRTEFLQGALTLDDAGYVVVDEPSTATSLPGVFACGDVVDSRYQQAITAAGTGAKAALDAEEYLDGLPA